MRWTELHDIEARAAANAQAAVTDPSALSIAVPEDLREVFGGVDAIPDDDWLGQAYRQGAVAAGLTAEQFATLSAAVMKHQAERFSAAHAEQMQALGDKAQQRIDAVKTWMTNTLSKEEAAALASVVTTADGVKAMETVMRRILPPATGDAPARGGAASQSKSRYPNTDWSQIRA